MTISLQPNLNEVTIAIDEEQNDVTVVTEPPDQAEVKKYLHTVFPHIVSSLD